MAVDIFVCLFVAEIRRNPVSKHQIQAEYGE